MSIFLETVKAMAILRLDLVSPPLIYMERSTNTAHLSARFKRQNHVTSESCDVTVFLLVKRRRR